MTEKQNNETQSVIPAQAGIQNAFKTLDSRLRGNDGNVSNFEIRISYLGFLCASVSLWLICFCFGPAAYADEGCVTAKCHSSIKSGKVVHPAAETCDSCHESVKKPHPEKSVKTFKLVQELPALCFTCHQAFSKKYIHTAVKNGSCTSCHDPHSSPQPRMLLKPANEICLTCHGDKQDYKNVHAPTATGDCLECHDPHQSDNEKQQVKPQPDLCFKCHPDMEEAVKKPHVHPALNMGCTACHNPHGSPVAKFLSNGVPKLCYQCHAEVEEKLKAAKVVHPPIKSEKSCLACHSPHASDAEKLLPKSGKDMCLSCHATVIKKEYQTIHGAITKSGCTGCHDQHGSPYARMLKKEFPSDMYVSYTDKEYELCFSCHNRDLLRYPETSFATGFRDGERNLHYVHVNRAEKGRSCIVCHSAHGSVGPKLINSSVVFGNWHLPIAYVKGETGGRCSPGCHGPKNYDRKSTKGT